MAEVGCVVEGEGEEAADEGRWDEDVGLDLGDVVMDAKDEQADGK